MGGFPAIDGALHQQPSTSWNDEIPTGTSSFFFNYRNRILLKSSTQVRNYHGIPYLSPECRIRVLYSWRLHSYWTFPRRICLSYAGGPVHRGAAVDHDRYRR